MRGTHRLGDLRRTADPPDRVRVAEAGQHLAAVLDDALHDVGVDDARQHGVSADAQLATLDRTAGWLRQIAAADSHLSQLSAATGWIREHYESPSQFSREYRRHFGAAPADDAARLRREAGGRAA